MLIEQRVQLGLQEQKDLNTSNVNVNPWIITWHNISKFDLNTSNVNVNLMDI